MNMHDGVLMACASMCPLYAAHTICSSEGIYLLCLEANFLGKAAADSVSAC